MRDDAAKTHPIHQLLPVERVGESAFEAVIGGFEGHAFGGATLGCATLAAAWSCEERSLTSIHAHFLRPVASGKPVRIDVEPLRDGRRLAHRRLRIAADGKLAFELLARFAAPRPGPELPHAALDAALPGPDALMPEAEVARLLDWEWWEPGVFEQRWVGTPWDPESGDGSHYAAWVRMREPLPDERALQLAAIAYLSDVHSHWPVARSLTGRFEPDGFTSLDEVIWFHREPAWDDWWLLTSQCDAGHAGRALSTRQLRSRDGRLVATMAQEALIPDRD